MYTYSERGPGCEVGSRPKFINVNERADGTVTFELFEHDGELSWSGPKLGEITLDASARWNLQRYLS